jgi:hypothetical protein
MFVKLGITGKESSAFGGFAFPFGEGKRGGGLDSSDIAEILIKLVLNTNQSTHYLLRAFSRKKYLGGWNCQ